MSWPAPGPNVPFLEVVDSWHVYVNEPADPDFYPWWPQTSWPVRFFDFESAARWMVESL